MSKPRFVYLASYTDKYELPFCVGDSMREIAEQLGISVRTVESYIQGRRTGENSGYKIEKVFLPGDDDDIYTDNGFLAEMAVGCYS